MSALGGARDSRADIAFASITGLGVAMDVGLVCGFAGEPTSGGPEKNPRVRPVQSQQSTERVSTV
jgi:hypothetical protein